MSENKKINKDKIIEVIFTKLWVNDSVLASMISRVGLFLEDNPEIPATGWNDGKHFYLNWAGIKKIKDISYDNLIMVAAHELMHTIMLTFERRGNRDPELWNYATDYAINDSLVNNVKDGKREPIGSNICESAKSETNPEGRLFLYDEKYCNKSAEEIYDDLLKEFKKQHNGKTPEEVRKEAIENAVKEWLEQQSNGQQLLDDHTQEVNQKDEDRQRQQIKIKEALESCSKMASKMGSALSRGLEYLLKEPPFDWRGFLSNYLKSFIKNDFTWKKPNRRSTGVGCILPGSNVESHIELGIAIDTSGSIDDEQVVKFLSHIQKIMNSFRSFNVSVWCFSTQVHEKTLVEYTQYKRDISNYKLESFGGTQIASSFDWINEKKKKFDVFICLTDGYDSIGDLRFKTCPVIWGITQNKNFVNPPGVMNAKVMYVDF